MPKSSKLLKQSELHNAREANYSYKKIILQYTLLYFIFAAGVFCVFIFVGNSLVHLGDGFKQGYFWLYEFKANLRSFFSGDGLPLWSWSRGMGMNIFYHLDVFDLIAVAFPDKYLDIGYSLEMILKLYCGGLFFLFYAIELNQKNFNALMGALSYAFSSWFISITMIQSSFNSLIYLTPLIVLSIDRIYRKKSPLLFILTVAYFIILDTYFAYMAAIGVIIYILFRYFAFADAYSFKDYILSVVRFFIYGTTGILLAGFALLASIKNLSEASTDSATDGYGLGIDFNNIIDFGKTLISGGYTNGYQLIGLPIFALLIIPIAWKHFSLKNTHIIVSSILIIMSFFPFFESMFNGFGYKSRRWYFLIVFFMSVAVMPYMNIEKLREKKNIILMSVWLLFISMWTVGLKFTKYVWFYKRSLAFVLMNIFAGIILIIVISAFSSSKFTIKHRQFAVLFISFAVLSMSWSMMFYLYKDSFMPVGKIHDQLTASTQRVSNLVDDQSFYRTDQVDWINFSQDSELPANENLYWGSKSIYGYDSYISSRQLELNKLLANSYNTIYRVCSVSNDNRMGLDFLYGVKYFFGNDEKNGRSTSDNYVGNSFDFYKNVDGVNVYKNNYDVSIGYGYTSYIKESEFLKLPIAEREQAMLQAIIIPDKTDASIIYNKHILNMNEKKANDIENSSQNLDFSIISHEGINISNDGKSFSVINPGAELILNVDNPYKSQMMLFFENLRRNTGEDFDISCSLENGRKEFIHRWTSNQSLSDVKDFGVNLGSINSYTGNISIKFSQTGTYNFDFMKLCAVKTSTFDKFAHQREESRLNVNSYSHKHVNGKILMPEDGVLFLSIPKYDSWEVSVDGKKSDVLGDVNIAFMGIPVSAGEHEIKLEYHNQSIICGAYCSVAVIIILFIIIILHKKSHINMHS